MDGECLFIVASILGVLCLFHVLFCSIPFLVFNHIDGKERAGCLSEFVFLVGVLLL